MASNSLVLKGVAKTADISANPYQFHEVGLKQSKGGSKTPDLWGSSSAQPKRASLGLSFDSSKNKMIINDANNRYRDANKKGGARPATQISASLRPNKTLKTGDGHATSNLLRAQKR